VTRLIFVRHGETDWNTARRLQGQADVGLSPTGRAQVEALRPLIAQLSVDGVTASDLRRTRESSAALGFVAPRLDRRLREADLGAWTARSIEELRIDEGEAYSAWRAGDYTPPGAEGWDAMVTRVCAALNELVAAGGNHLIVTHGGPIRAACLQLLGLHPRHVLPVAPASITVIELRRRPRLAIYNLTARPLELDAPD
jgi:broad specificity phosphatase PhoE